MFACKVISRKVHGPTRSKNAQDLLLWVYREQRMHLYVVSAYDTPLRAYFHRHHFCSMPPMHVGLNFAHVL